MGKLRQRQADKLSGINIQPRFTSGTRSTAILSSCVEWRADKSRPYVFFG